jgi:transposase
MAVNVRGFDRDQQFLMPPSLRDWLSEDHLAWFVADVVDALDLSAFYASYRDDGRGGATYDPALMLAVLLYAYCSGERSSRRIEAHLVDDVAYRVLAANERPDHATLARFRRRHQDAIAELFGQVLGLCIAGGLVDTSLVAIDGTKMAADASFEANRTKEELAAQILGEAEAVDAAEDVRFGDRPGAEPAEGWERREDRRARIKEALEQLEAQSGRDYESKMAERAAKEEATGHKLTGPKPTATPARPRGVRKANVTDPDSRIMATFNKRLQGYNAQAAASADQVIVAAEVHNITNDQASFVPMAKAVNENLAAAGHLGGTEVFLADAGYWSAANATTDVGADVLIATRKNAWRSAPTPSDERLAVLARVNAGELSQRAAGDILGVSYTWVRDMTKRYFGTTGQRISSTSDPDPAEWIPVIEQLDRAEISRRAAVDQLGISATRVKTMLAHVRGEAPEPSMVRRAMDDKLAQDDNAARFARRKVIIEPVFGNIKANRGYRSFTRRGMAAVQSEWRLICTTHNLLKLRMAFAG